uniref:Centrosomal protein 89 n=1 Tax=Scophthalmus maximus TaxID=52904 RepID=A0A8D3C8T9_SCOMX
MLRKFQRHRDKEFKHIAPGLIPAASIAPKPAVPRTPPPRRPDPSHERPRSALAAAILSSSLTGQTWALPPARPRSYSRVNNQSPSYLKRTSAKHLTPGNHPLENASVSSQAQYDILTVLRDRWSDDLAGRPHLPSPDHSDKELKERGEEVQDEEDREVEDEEDGDDHIYQTLDRGEPCPVTEPVYALPLKPKVGLVRKVLLLCDIYSRRTVLPGSQAELQGLRRHAQELVDENDALKLTVHRLNVELSHYQTHFRPLSKQESSKISGLPKIGSPPPWLLDMKYLSPLLLAYEDRMKEKDALLQTTEEDVKRLRVHVEEVIHENERLHNEIAKLGGVGQKDCHQIQKQAFLVLQENQVLIDQLEAQHVKAKANHSRHHSEVSKVSKQLMLLEAENQRLQEDLEESRREAQKNTRQIQDLQARLKNAITWDEHCNIAGKLRGYHHSVDFIQYFFASGLQQEKHGFVNRILNGTVRFGKLQEDVKVSSFIQTQASTRLAALEEAAEGRTASYQRQILHLQRLLRERQEAEERLLQSKR